MGSKKSELQYIREVKKKMHNYGKGKFQKNSCAASLRAFSPNYRKTTTGPRRNIFIRNNRANNLPDVLDYIMRDFIGVFENSGKTSK